MQVSKADMIDAIGNLKTIIESGSDDDTYMYHDIFSADTETVGDVLVTHSLKTYGHFSIVLKQDITK